MKIAYLDCFSGISGDMFLGALVDAGVPLSHIEQDLRRLPVRGYQLTSKKVLRSSITATKVDVIVQKPKVGGRRQEAKRWDDIKKIITTSSLPDQIKQKGLRIFKGLYEAEGKVHGIPYKKTHLHELGAVDCIVDIFGALIGINLLGIEKIYASPLNLGSGTVRTAHGRLPVPAPATAEIVTGIPVYASDTPFELTTPTGAALLREIADGFTNMPHMKITKIGYGAGQKDIEGIPNTLRVFIGEIIPEYLHAADGQIVVIETNIDDMNPQLYEYVMEKLFAAGARDVYLTTVIMKKGRPGIVLTVLCSQDRQGEITDILFKETSTIGVRFHTASRTMLHRNFQEAASPFGKLRIKVSRTADGMTKSTPEYEDCRRAAQKYNVPLLDVIKAAGSVKKLSRKRR